MTSIGGHYVSKQISHHECEGERFGTKGLPIQCKNNPVPWSAALSGQNQCSTTIRSSLYSIRHTLCKKLVPFGERFVYNTALVRQLCADIAAETDSDRVTKLADLLQAVVREDQEEIRVRMGFLKRQYSHVMEQSQAAD